MRIHIAASLRNKLAVCVPFLPPEPTILSAARVPPEPYARNPWDLPCTQAPYRCRELIPEFLWERCQRSLSQSSMRALRQSITGPGAFLCKERKRETRKESRLRTGVRRDSITAFSRFNTRFQKWWEGWARNRWGQLNMDLFPRHGPYSPHFSPLRIQCFQRFHYQF